MVGRLTAICRELDTATAQLRAQQIGLLIDGAFMSDAQIIGPRAMAVLADAVDRLIGASD